MVSTILIAQNNTVDSLKKALQTAKEDSNKVNILAALSYSYRDIDEDTGLDFGLKAFVLAKKLNWQNGIAVSYTSIGNNYFSHAETSEALDYFYKALTINQQEGNKKGIADKFSLIGNVYQSMSDYLRALNYRKRSLELSEELGNKSDVGNSFNNLGVLYKNLGDYPKALENFLKGLKTYEQIGDKIGMAKTLGSIGFFYTDLTDYPKALEYDEKSLEIFKQVDDKLEEARCLTAIANIYSYLADDLKALDYNKQSLRLFEQAGDKPGIATCLGNIGNSYLELSDYMKAIRYNQNSYDLSSQINNMSGMANTLYHIGDIYYKADNISLAKMGISPSERLGKAIENLNGALKISSKIGDLKLQEYILAELGLVYEKQNNIAQSQDAYKKLITIHDSIIKGEKRNEIARNKIQYEYDKKEAAAKSEQEKKDAMANAEILNQKLIRNFSLTGIIVVVALSGYGFYRYKKKRQQQSQQAIANERLRISRELHDEVGSTLSGIAMYSHVTKRLLTQANETEVEKSLNIIQQSADEMVGKLNDIVWLINPEQGSLQMLIQRLEEYANDMAAIKGMKVTVTMPEKMQPVDLPIETRRCIYLFCKEAINNSVKYSEGTKLELSVREINNMLEFSVADNGKGFNETTIRRGNGLNNMQKRAEEIGAGVVLETKCNAGSKLFLQVKI